MMFTTDHLPHAAEPNQRATQTILPIYRRKLTRMNMPPTNLMMNRIVTSMSMIIITPIGSEGSTGHWKDEVFMIRFIGTPGTLIHTTIPGDLDLSPHV